MQLYDYEPFHHNMIQEKSVKSSQESSRMISQLQDENHDLKQRKTKLNKDKVMLEQENEDLQRRERYFNLSLIINPFSELSATVGDLQDKLNKLIEDSAMYQIEFDEEQESNKEIIQRLRDENRDLEQELHVLRKSTSPASPRKAIQSPRQTEPAKPHRPEHLCEKCGRKSSPIRLVKLQKVDPETLKTIVQSSPSSPLQSPPPQVKAKRGNSSPVEKPKEQQQVEKPPPTTTTTTKNEPPQTPPNRARSTTFGASTPRNIVSTPRPVLTPRLQALSTPRKQPTSYLVGTPINKQQQQASNSTRSRSSSVPQKKNIDL